MVPILSPSSTLKNGLQTGIAVKWRGYTHHRQHRKQFCGAAARGSGLGCAIPGCRHPSGLLEMKKIKLALHHF
jgi:hypothetical protein